MHLENIKIRIKKYQKGYVVEIQKSKCTLFGLKNYWTHLISVSGMSDKPWYYSSEEIAISEAIKFFNWDLLIGTKDNQ